MPSFSSRILRTDVLEINAERPTGCQFTAGKGSRLGKAGLVICEGDQFPFLTDPGRGLHEFLPVGSRSRWRRRTEPLEFPAAHGGSERPCEHGTAGRPAVVPPLMHMRHIDPERFPTVSTPDTHQAHQIGPLLRCHDIGRLLGIPRRPGLLHGRHFPPRRRRRFIVPSLELQFAEHHQPIRIIQSSCLLCQSARRHRIRRHPVAGEPDHGCRGSGTTVPAGRRIFPDRKSSRHIKGSTHARKMTQPQIPRGLQGLPRRRLEIAHGNLRPGFHTLAVKIHPAHEIHGPCVAGIRSLMPPAQRFPQIQRHPVTIAVTMRQFHLRRSIATRRFLPQCIGSQPLAGRRGHHRHRHHGHRQFRIHGLINSCLFMRCPTGNPHGPQSQSFTPRYPSHHPAQQGIRTAIHSVKPLKIRAIPGVMTASRS